MTLSTRQVQAAWGPKCSNANPNGDAMRVMWSVIDRVMVVYGYVVRPGVTSAANCRKIAGTNVDSIHSWYDDEAYTFEAVAPGAPVTIKLAAALDTNSDRNPMGSRLVTDMLIERNGVLMPDAIEAVRTNNGKQVVVWGGYWSRPDAMHWQPGCTPDDIRTGIDPATLPQEDEMLTPEEREFIEGMNLKLDDIGAAVTWIKAVAADNRWNWSTLANIAAAVSANVAEIDEEAIAVAVAGYLPSVIGQLSDADVQRIAAAAADEHARRLQS